MQAQTTASRWFKFNPIMVLTLAAGIVLAVATLAVSDVVDLPYASESETANTSASDAVQERQLRYTEQKFQLPDTSAVTSAPSIGQQAERPYAPWPLDRPATLDQSGPIHANRGEHRATASELGETLTVPIQSSEQTHFYEQNVWEYSDASPEAPGIHHDEGLDDGLIH